MLRRPTLKAHYRSVSAGSDVVVLLSERGNALLEGDVYGRLLPLLDGRHSPDDIVEALAGTVNPALVYFALQDLEAKGYLAEAPTGDPAAPSAAHAWWHALDLDPSVAGARLSGARVRVRSAGAPHTEPLVDALSRAAITANTGDAHEPTLTIVVCADYLAPELDSINREALASGRPWLLVRLGGVALWSGPVFRPGEGACWACIAHRLRRNRPFEAFVGAASPGADATMVAAGTAASDGLAAAIVASQVERYLAGASDPRFSDAIVTVDLASLAAQSHVVTRRPQCPVCGNASLYATLAAQPVHLDGTPPRGVAGTDGPAARTSPAELLRKHAHLVDPVVGLTAALHRFSPADDPDIHVYVAGPNGARPRTRLAGLRRDLRSPAAGKGMTDAHARFSALAEVIEREAAVFQGDEPRRRATARELGDLAVHPNAVALFSDAQLADRRASDSRATPTPVPFDENVAIDWTPCWSLTAGTHRWYPTMCTYYGYPVADDQAYGYADSNGCAAGTTIADAVLSGLLELVERDAVAIWWYNRLHRPALDIASARDPELDRIVGAYSRYGREAWVLDVTNDLGIPVFVAVSRRTTESRGAEGTESLLIGLGAHVDPRIALRRAVTELNQMVAAAAALPGAGSHTLASDLAWWLTEASLASQPYLAPSSEPVRVIADYRCSGGGDVLDNIAHCRRALEAHGLEVLAVDQSRPDIGLPVAKVIVPGLRHFWRRYAPGRLYDVPVTQGWRATAMAEGALNPVAMFL